MTLFIVKSMKKITSKLSKTPYLVLLTVLIAVTVTSAYALSITLGADTVFVTGDLDISGANSTDIDTIYFDDSFEWLDWFDEPYNRFEFSNDVAMFGVVDTGGLLDLPVDYNRMGTGTTDHPSTIASSNDLFVTSSMEVDGVAYFDNSIGVGTAGNEFDDIIDFNNETRSFWWDVEGDTFVMNDDLQLQGKLTVLGLIDPPAITFSAENHDRIKQLSSDVEDHEVVMLFWNTNSKVFEVYHIAEDTFYNLNGEQIPTQSSNFGQTQVLKTNVPELAPTRNVSEESETNSSDEEKKR